MLSSLILILFAKEILLLHPATLPYYSLLTTQIVSLPDAVFAVRDSSALGRLDRSQNAVWLEHRWLQEGVTAGEMSSLCERLQKSRIRYVYPHLTPSSPDGRLPPFSAEAARRFRKILRQRCPEVLVLPWIGGVQVGFQQMRKGTISLDSEVYLQAFAGECIYLTGHLGFDGIHLNIEPVESGSRRLLEWLEYLKQRIGPEKILSMAAAKPSFIEGLNFSPLRSWDVAYYESVARHCDQVVVMSYDTGLSSAFLYSLFVFEKTSAILQRFSRAGLSTKLMLGIPTYGTAMPHEAKAENIPAAIQGLKAALSRSDVRKENFGGTALYAYWTTEEGEWQDFLNLWLNVQE